MKQIIKKSLIVWCYYLLFSVVLLGVDYLVRLKQGYIQRSSTWVSLSTEGIPIEIHTGLLVIGGGISVIFLLKAMKGINNVFLKYGWVFFENGYFPECMRPFSDINPLVVLCNRNRNRQFLAKECRFAFNPWFFEKRRGCSFMRGVLQKYLFLKMVTFQSACGLLVTLILWLYYVTETGIDSF